MATAQDIKDFFGLIGKDVSNAHLTALGRSMVRGRVKRTNGERLVTPTPDDFIEWIYGELKRFHNRQMELEARDAATPVLAELLAV